MNLLINILIFCIILFLYIHIYFHLKTSNDLETYEIQNPAKDRLEEICDFKQPVQLFLEENPFQEINLNYLLNNYSGFDLKIRNFNNTPNNNTIKSNDIPYLPLNITTLTDLFEKSNNENYISEKNYEFLEETGVNKKINQVDSYFRPALLSNYNYDFIYGKNSITPLRYSLSYRNYFIVTKGSCKVKLVPPIFNKYLNEIKDYDNYEFRSPLNLWDIQEQYKYDFAKIKILELELMENQILFIPAYWYYTFEFNNCSMINLEYKTYMNNLAILPHLIKKIFQQMNIKNDYLNKGKFLKNSTGSNNIELNKDNETLVINQPVEDNNQKVN